ncbi:MAG: LCP family protein [Acidimicrobiales bacterium]
MTESPTPSSPPPSYRRVDPIDGRAGTDVAGRRGRRDQAGRGFDESGLRALGDEISRGVTRRRPWRKQRWVRRTALVAGLAVVIAIAGAASYNWYLFNQIHTVAVKGLSTTGVGVESGTENILMVGSTDRCSLPKSDPLYQDCVAGHTGINSDVVMILHLNSATRRVSILSIPRDTFVPNARADGANKIDAALYEGPTQLVAAIEDDFGIPIQHYMELNFASFANVVQTIGGVRMYFPEPVYDHEVGLDVETPGCVYLNGGDALKLVRSRELQYKGPGVTTDDHFDWPHDPQSDLARILRDHEFLRVLATAVAHKGLANPITDERLVAALAPQVEMDPQLKGQLLGLVSSFHAVNPNAAPELTLPIQAPNTSTGYVYKGSGYGDVVYPTVTEDEQAIDQFLGTPPTVDTMNGRSLPRPASVTVSVLNGTGVTNQATDTANAFAALGFKIGSLGNTEPVGTPAETVVTYAAPADEGAAELVSRQLTGVVIMALGATTGASQVTVTTGTDFSVKPPPSSVASPPSTTAPVSSATASLAPPSQLVSPLKPWDPRSCTPSGGEGP